LVDNNKLKKAIAIIISGTRRGKRNIDMVKLVDSISYAEQCMGSLNAVAESVKLSVQQLKDFLAVNKLCKEVKKLVSERAIDSVDVVKNIGQLPKEKQIILAREITKGRISSKDVRIITTFMKKFPTRSVQRILRDYYESRDKKTYVVQFAMLGNGEQNDLKRFFEKMLGKDVIVSLETKGGKTNLEVSAEGYRKLREAAKRKRTSLRKFFTNILRENRWKGQI